VAVIVVAAGVIGREIADLTSELPRYEATVVSKVHSLEEATIGSASRLIDRIDRDFQKSANPGGDSASAEPPASIGTASGGAGANPLGSPLSLIGKIVSPVLSPLGTLGIVLILSLFILLQKDDLRDRLIRLFASYDLDPSRLAVDDASDRLSRFFLARLWINAAYALVIGLALFAIGIPKPLLWGCLAGVLRFIPYVGWIIAAALPGALAVAIDPGWSMALLTAIIFTMVETITGQIVEPMLFGRSTGLSPFAIVVAAIVWGWLWGPIGLLLSTPLTLCLVVLARHFEPLKFLDVLLGDKPAPINASAVDG
jgi:predicted PurR-regulated permease PerM